MPGPQPQTMRLIDPDGITRDVPVEAAAGLLQDSRWRVPTAEDAAARISEQAKEEAYGGVGGAVKAGLAAGARGATLGLSDVAARALGGGDTAIELEGLRDVNPGISGAAEFAGALAPALASGGAGLLAGRAAAAGAELGAGGRALAGAARIGEVLPAGLVSRAGAAVGSLVPEAGALGKIGGAALGDAAEGALFGAGQGVSELALSQDPLSVEHVASALSSNMLYGAGLGAGLGGLGKAAELGLSRAKGAIDDALKRRAVKAATPEEAIRQGDLQGIDRRILDTAERAEVERIEIEQAPQRARFTSELDDWRKANRDAHDIREITHASPDPNLREASGAFDRANLKLRAALDDKAGFAEDPARSLRVVRTQGQALEDMLSATRTQERLWREAVDAAPQRFRADIEAISSKSTLAERAAESRKRGFGGEYTGPFTPAGLDTAAERAVKEYSAHQWDGAVRNGLKEPSFVSRIPKIEAMLAENQRLQSQLLELAKPPTSELLTKIAEARAVLDVPKAPSLGGALVSAAAPFAGPVGAAAAAGGRVIGSFRKLAAAAGERVAKVSSSFLGAAQKAAKVATPLAPILATKILAAVRYSDDGNGKRPAAGGTTLPDLYEARAGEVRSQVAIAPDGSYQMRPAERAKMAAKFDGIRTADPVLADQLEELGARRLEYLASIMPRLPDYAAMPGIKAPRISDMAMRSWARSAAALENPYGVLDRAVNGHVTLEDAAAIRKVYPELLSDFLGRIGTQERKGLMPFKQRLALSILSGEPHDPALTPEVLSILQGSFVNDAGVPSTQAPTAMPAFGSVKRSIPDPTPSQRRAQGAQGA